MSLYGHVRGVKQITLGSDVAVDIVPGATSVVLDDVLDFEVPETGYPLTLNMVSPEALVDDLAVRDINLLTYTALDESTRTATLEFVTETTYFAGGRVEVYPKVTLRHARVALDDAEEEATGVRALVPHALYDKLPIGQRESAQEAVEVEDTGSDYIVSNVRGKEPEMDGAFLLDSSVDGAAKVFVNALSAFTVNAGKLTAGEIIGLLIATDEPGKPRVAMKDVAGENDRFKVYGQGGVLIGTLRADLGDIYLNPVPGARAALDRVTVREGSVRVMGDETWQGANYGLFIEDAALLGTPNTTGSHTDLGDNAGNVPGAPPTGRARLFYQVRSGAPNRLAVIFPNGNVKQVVDDS